MCTTIFGVRVFSRKKRAVKTKSKPEVENKRVVEIKSIKSKPKTALGRRITACALSYIAKRVYSLGFGFWVLGFEMSGLGDGV